MLRGVKSCIKSICDVCFSACTDTISVGVCEVDGIRIRLIDTPGLIDTNKDTYSILTEIAKVSSTILLPAGSEYRGVLGVESIHVAILPSCQDMKIVALQLHKHEYSWAVNIWALVSMMA